MITFNEWCSINSGLLADSNIASFDITDAGCRQFFRQHNGLHTYENLNKKLGWVCAKGKIRGYGDDIESAELSCAKHMYREAN